MPKLQAITPEMLQIAETIQKKAGELLAGQRRVTAIAGGMKQDFSGALPNLMLDQLVSMGDQYDAMYYALEGYAKALALAAEKYNATDEAIAKNIRAAMAAMGISMGAGAAAGAVVTDAPVQVFTTEGLSTPTMQGAQHPVPNATFHKKDGFLVKRPGISTDYPNGHSGYDFRGNGGEPIVSSAEGKVVKSYNSTSYGNTAIVEYKVNGQYYYVTYAHMRDLPLVKEGVTIPAGTTLGYLGATGAANGVPHLHLDVRQNSNPSLQLSSGQLFEKSAWKGSWYSDPAEFFSAVGVTI